MAQYKYIAAQPVYICAQFVVNPGRSPGGFQRVQYKCVTAQPVYAGARSQSAVNAVRPRRACLSAQEPVTTASHPKSVTSPAPAFFGRHVASPPVANQPARVQCASRSSTKVFVGRRLAPRPAPGKYRWSSSACFVRSSATLTVMASPNHPRCSQACSAKYGAGSRAAALPNPSVKLSANGVPHWPPSAGPVAHFALAVQRATPLAPAYLKR